MRKRQLGSNGLEVSAIGLGAMGFSGSYGEADDAESINTIRRAMDLGVTFIDTADAYGNGHNEQLVGKAIAGRRSEVALATKFGFVDTPRGAPPEINGHPDYVREAIEASLERLGVEYVDLYYLHRVDPKVPIEETVGAMARLVEEGKVRHLGLSEVGPAILRRAHAVHPIAAVQNEYALWFRQPESELMPTLQELGTGLVAFSPLGRGLLAGAIAAGTRFSESDTRANMPRFQQENLQRNLRFVDVMAQVASARGATPAQVALAWMLCRWDDVVPIPGSRHFRHIKINALAADIDLSQEDLDRLNDATDATPTAGARYTPAHQRLVDQGR